MKNIAKINFVIIATLVGAGFASGKEIYSFFFMYGINGIIGVFISSLIISFTIYKVLKICHKYNINTFEEFCCYIVKNTFKSCKNKKVKEISEYINKIINIFLLVSFYIMISGFSSFLKQEFNVNRYVGSIIIVVLCYIAFQNKMNSLIKISDFLVPILIVFIVFISAMKINVIENFNTCGKLNRCFMECSCIIPFIKAALYGGYNCILLIPVLIPLRKMAGNLKNITKIFGVSFLTIVVLCLSVYNILLLGNNNIYGQEMPIISIVSRYGEICKIAYLFLIASSIYTTAISTGCGFLNGCSSKKYYRNCFIICLTAIFISQIKFSFFVNLLYPVLGVFGLIEVSVIMFAIIRQKSTCK